MAELAAAGRTNREIADELVVSVRTVESQLSAVYGKLGVRGRATLARALARAGTSGGVVGHLRPSGLRISADTFAWLHG